MASLFHERSRTAELEQGSETRVWGSKVLASNPCEAQQGDLSASAAKFEQNGKCFIRQRISVIK